MDRIISLLAALVGLIALGGAILVHINADAERQDLAAQIAELRTSLRSGAMPASETSAVAPASMPEIAAASSPSSVASTAGPSEEAAMSASTSLDPAAQISELQARVAELEQQNASQASALADAQSRLAAASSAPALAIEGTDALSPSILASSSATSAEPSVASSASSEAAAAGPTTDCIPLGTRFVGKAGDKFPICRSKAVVKILGVSDGQAIVEGAGPIATGGFGNLSSAPGCTVMVFTADVTGYADLRVTCQ